MSSGSSGTQKVVQQSGPPDILKPYVASGAADAQRLYQAGGPQVFPGSTVTGLSPQTMQGWAATSARALGGSPLTSAAQGWATNALRGQSPLDDPLYQSVASQVIPSVGSQFSAAGRYGSDAHAEALSRGLTEGWAPFALQEKTTAASLANPLANQDYTDLAQLQGVGTARDQYGQALVTDAYNRFNAQQQRPYSNMNWYTSQLYGSPWGTQTSKQPVYQPGVGQQVAGGVLGALGTAAQFLPLLGV
jgi:hypothetical protein